MSRLNHAGSISLLWVGSLANAVLLFAMQVYLARALTLEQYGIFSAVSVVIGVLGSLASFGIGQFWLKAFGEEGMIAVRWRTASFKLFHSSIGCVLSVAGLWALIGNPDKQGGQIVVLLAAWILAQGYIDLLVSKLQLERRYLSLCILLFLPVLLRIGAVALLFFLFPELDRLLLTGFATAAVASFVGFAGHLGLRSMRLNGTLNLGLPVGPAGVDVCSPARLVDLFRVVWPYGLSGVLYLIYFQCNIVLLRYVGGAEEAAIYNVAFLSLGVVYLFPGVVYQRYLTPHLHRWATHDPKRLARVHSSGVRLMILLGGVGMLSIFILGGRALELVFGEPYAASVPILYVLAVGMPLRFLVFAYGALLVTKENMRCKVACMSTVALFNIFAGWFAIGIWGAVGAAAVAVAGEMVLLFLYWRSVRKNVFN